jgi:hypothetical protein
MAGAGAAAAAAAAAAVAGAAELPLDPRLRDWVLLPIFVVMVAQGFIRQYMADLLREPKKLTRDTAETRCACVSARGRACAVSLTSGLRSSLLRRSQMLRAHASFLTPEAWRMRKRFFCEKAFRAREGDEGSGQQRSHQDPFAMMGMMKQNMAMIVSNMLMMGWISYFFQGFVVVRLPFAVFDRLKVMLQRGVALNSLNVSYVSTLSWYLLLLFGLRGLFSLVLGSNNEAVDQTRVMEEQMNAGAMQQDPQKQFDQERTELEILHHEWAAPAAELRLLGVDPATAAAAAAADASRA